MIKKCIAQLALSEPMILSYNAAQSIYIICIAFLIIKFKYMKQIYS